MQGGAGFGLGQPLVQGQMGQAQMAPTSQPGAAMGGFAQMLGMGAQGGGADPQMAQRMMMLQQMLQQQQQSQQQPQVAQMPMNVMGSNGRQPGMNTGTNRGYLAQGGGVANRQIVGKSY